MSKMVPLLFTVIVLVNFFHQSQPLPNGAPVTICDTLLPFHGGGIPPLTSTSPFRITPFASSVGQGQILRLEIESNPPSLNFGGFMIHARNLNSPYEVVGRFLPSSDGLVKLISCADQEDTATHVSPAPKSNLILEWQAPTNFIGEVVFNSTIAQEYDKFWVGLTSSRIRVVQSGQAPPPAIGISTTRNPIYASTPGYVQPAARPVPVATDPFYEGCGDTKSCFGFPEDCVNSKSCRAVAATIVNGEKYIFEMKAGYNRPAYVAVGLSYDDKMGDDSVIECVPESGTVKAFSSWTRVGPYGVTRSGIPQNIIKLLESSYIDGTIYCRVERDATSLVRGKRFDLINDKLHVLVASGTAANSSQVGYHDIGRIASSEPRALSVIAEFKGASKLLLRLHGAFMLVAWIGTASIGILMARYFKQTWVGSSLCGKDQWFAWHRFFMVLTWILTIAGFVLIFVELGAWSSAPNPHAILGTITTILCFFQPIAAFFRPHPGHKNRPLFNWGHWLGGNLAHIIGIVTIFFAVKLTKAELPEWLDYILVAYVAFHVFMHFIFSISGCMSERRSVQRVTSFPMADMTPNRHSVSSGDRKQDAPFSGFRKILLALYIIVITMFVIALVIIAVLAPIEDTVETIKSKIME